MMVWQPIETAPRNQTFLAVLNCGGEQTICTMRWPVAEAKNSRPDSKTFHVERVTHWMPLPGLPGAQPPQSVPNGWLRAIDEALVVAHIGVANPDDTYEQAREKLDSLIGFHADVATDPAVNGGWKLVPIEPTEEMINKVIHERIDALVSGKDHSMLDIYHAMLAAAPKPDDADPAPDVFDEMAKALHDSLAEGHFYAMKPILYWPDGTWCYRHEREQMSHMSDDFTLIHLPEETEEELIQKYVDWVLKK